MHSSLTLTLLNIEQLYISIFGMDQASCFSVLLLSQSVCWQVKGLSASYTANSLQANRAFQTVLKLRKWLERMSSGSCHLCLCLFQHRPDWNKVEDEHPSADLFREECGDQRVAGPCFSGNLILKDKHGLTCCHTNTLPAPMGIYVTWETKGLDLFIHLVFHHLRTMCCSSW